MPSPFAFPLLHNSQRTQISGTTPTYRKASGILRDLDLSGPGLDYGAGLGLGAVAIGFDSFEPHPRQGFLPTYRLASTIPNDYYSAVLCLNVLNVVPPDVWHTVTLHILRVMRPDNAAIIIARGSDVLSAQGGVAGLEPMSLIFGVGQSARPQD